MSDIRVKDASTLVKTDGTEVKVSEDAKIEDATESTETTNADVVTKEEPKEDTIVADGGNTDSNVSEGNENAGDNGNVSDTPSDTPSNEPVETPDVPNTPSEPEYVPNVPSEPEPTPEEPQPSEPSEPSEPEEQAKTPVYCMMDFRTSDGVEDTRDATVGEYIFKKYINGEITESEAESLMLNGALINVKVRYDDGSEEIIDEITGVKSIKWIIKNPDGEEIEFNVGNNTSKQELLLALMSNWEDAVSWVWSTCLDCDIEFDDGQKLKIPSMGTYTKVDELAEAIYVPNVYYIENGVNENGKIIYKLASEEYNSEIRYYK